jgi:hypothetical protein
VQLRIQRSQRASFTSVVIFCLDIRADYTPEEADNIRRYRLGGQGLYNSRASERHLDAAGRQLERVQDGDLKNRAAGLVQGAFSMALAKMHLNVTIASLAKGHHIECRDLEELLEAEDTLRSACKNLTRYLEVAGTFDGSEVVVEYVNGEEQVHLARNVPPLLEGPSDNEEDADDAEYEETPSRETDDGSILSPELRAWWLSTEQRLLARLNRVPLLVRNEVAFDVIDLRIACTVAAAFLVAVLLIAL